MTTSPILVTLVIGALGTLTCFAVAAVYHIKGQRQAERDMANVRRWRLKQRLITSKATLEAETLMRLTTRAIGHGIVPLSAIIPASRRLEQARRDARTFNVYGG